MVKVRKKPVEVEAIRYIGFGDGGEWVYAVPLPEGGLIFIDPQTFSTELKVIEPPAWFTEAVNAGKNNPGGIYGGVHAGEAVLMIHTLEAPHVASPGDWIVRGIHGELYPCKPDIFAATYDLAE